jgi:hypothetical protein
MDDQERSMSIDVMRSFLLWCTVINYMLLLWWSLLFLFAHHWAYRITCRWVRISVEVFDAVNYGGIALYKIGIFLFNLVPCIALWIVG